MAYTVADDIALDAFGAWQTRSRSARGGGSARAAAAPRFRAACLRYVCRGTTHTASQGSATMPDLKKKFSRKEWKDCCGKGCKKCEIAQTYIGVYGKSKGLDKLNEDRKEMQAKKSGKKKGGKKKSTS